MLLRVVAAKMAVIAALVALAVGAMPLPGSASDFTFGWQWPVLWRLNGVQPPGPYHVESYLKAIGPTGGTFTWTVTSGFSKAGIVDGGNVVQTVTRSGPGAERIIMRSKAPSTSSGDVVVHLTWNGTDEGSTTHTVRSPGHLHPIREVDLAWGNGYDSYIHYYIHDQFHVTLPADVPVNEVWVDPAHTSDCGGDDWFRPNPNGLSVDPSDFYDEIGVSGSTNPPVQNPQNPLGQAPVDHWGQRFCVGSVTIGLGTPVETHWLQRYRDHGRHTHRP